MCWIALRVLRSARVRQMRELALFVSDERKRQDAQLLEVQYKQAANARKGPERSAR
jgi:hypothetical protein